MYVVNLHKNWITWFLWRLRKKDIRAGATQLNVRQNDNTPAPTILQKTMSARLVKHDINKAVSSN